MLFECTPNAAAIRSISHPSSNTKYKARCFRSRLIVRYTMYVHSEYSEDREQIGDEESVLEILWFFDFFAIFEPPQTRGTWISETTVVFAI